MCFVKSKLPQIQQVEQPPAVVQRHEADASLTKTSQKDMNSRSYSQNIKTSNAGIEEQAQVSKKRLLGE